MANTGAHPLTHIQKSNLGRLISTRWYTTSSSQKLTSIQSIEDTGTFKVLAYPDNFSDTIDELIDAFYKSLNGKRKRIVVKKSVWSAKPSNNI
jgi:hypothetical protein